jgi:hypothetical protein
MQDLQTGSLWSQINGECISGELEGKILSPLPALHTTFSEFKELYPEGLLLEKPEKGESGSSYDSYFADPDKLGIFGRADNFQKLDGKDKVFGLRLGKRQVAVSEDYLVKNSLTIISGTNPPIIVTYDDESKTVAAFALRDHSHTDLENIRIEDNALFLSGDNAAWDSRTGMVKSGDANSLDPIPAISAYWFAWISFFPDTELIK